MKGISRIDSNHTHGWFVRVFRNGGTHSKMFSDGVHGGKEKALIAAQEYKDDYERLHPPSPAATRLRTRPLRNNTTGVVGVSDTHDRSKTGKKIPCFSVSWRPKINKTCCKKFYYHHYESREAAFEAAVAFRKERESEILEELNKDFATEMEAALKETPKKKVVRKKAVIKKASTAKTNNSNNKTAQKKEMKQEISTTQTPETKTIQEKAVVNKTVVKEVLKKKVTTKELSPSEKMLAFLKSKPMR